MKKKLPTLLVLPAALCALMSFAACDDGSALAHDTKYYIAVSSYGNDDCKRTYYLFNNDGTGVYHEYGSYSSSFNSTGYTWHYTVTFDYSYVDKDKETIICTYKSVEYADDDNQKGVSSSWSSILTVSADFVTTVIADRTIVFYNETYLNDHPELGAKN